MSQSPADVSLLGVRVHDVAMDEAVTTLSRWLHEPDAHQLVTVNPEFVMAVQALAWPRMVFSLRVTAAALAVPRDRGRQFATRRELCGPLGATDYATLICKTMMGQQPRLFPRNKRREPIADRLGKVQCVDGRCCIKFWQ